MWRAVNIVAGPQILLVRERQDKHRDGGAEHRRRAPREWVGKEREGKQHRESQPEDETPEDQKPAEPGGARASHERMVAWNRPFSREEVSHGAD